MFLIIYVLLVAENGSGGFMGDLLFKDGTIGIRCKFQPGADLASIFST